MPERSYSMDGQKALVFVIWLVFALVFVGVGFQPDMAYVRFLCFVGAVLAVAAAVASLRVRLDVCPLGLVVVSQVRSRRVIWSEIAGFEVVNSNSTGGRCLGIRLANGRLLRSRAVAYLSPEKVQGAIAELDQDLGRDHAGPGPGPDNGT